MALERLILSRLLAKPSAVELSTVIWVGSDWGWSSSCRICRMWTVSWPLWNVPAISASEAAAMMFLRILLSTWMGPLGVGLLAGSLVLPR